MQAFNRLRLGLCKTNKRYFSTVPKIELPKLQYKYDELEPVLSRELVEIHHAKHHQTYVTNYNNALDQVKNALDTGNHEKLISLQGSIKFNGGSHINHSIYWTNLAPVKNGGGALPDANSGLRRHIEGTWGSMDNFINIFSANTTAIQGSGWGWLVYNKGTKSVNYLETPNQDPVCMNPNLVPLLTMDVWEHAYYISYKNARANYVKELWKVINWRNVEERYNNALKL